MRRRFIAIPLVLLIAAMLAWPATSAWAHANFVRSDPAPNTVLDVAPAKVQIWFSEPLEPGFSGIQVLNPQGQPVDNGDSRVTPDDPASMVVTLPSLPKSAYIVSWKTLSKVDGHIARGTFSLFIGVPATPTALEPPREFTEVVPMEAVVRWLGYASIALLLGPLLLILLVLTPVAARFGQDETVLFGGLGRLRALQRLAWFGLVAGTLGALALQVVSLGNGPESSAFGTLGGLLGTRYGAVWLARAACTLALGVIVLSLRSGWSPRAAWAGVVVSGGVLLTFTLNSHSASVTENVALAIAADWLHLWGVMAWSGGLVTLAVILPASLARLQGEDRWRLLAAVIPRFSVLAAISVALFGVTGLYEAFLHVGSVSALVETMHGKSLLTKTLLVSPALLLGAANLLVLSPRLRQAVADPARFAEAARLGRRFSRTVAGEAVLVLLVLVAASVMTSFPPGASTYQQILATRPLPLQSVVSDMQVRLSVLPSQPGAGTYTVTLTAADGRPITDAELVQVSSTFLDQPLGTNAERATSNNDGTYTATGSLISVEGRWQLELLIRRAGRDDARGVWRVLFTSSSASEDRAAPTAQRGAPELAGIGLAVFGVALVIYVIRTVGVRSLNGATLVFVSLAIVGLGGYLVVNGQTNTTLADIRLVVNPFPPTEGSIATGRELYMNQCQVCHGATGRGDGPAGLSLNPRPADFRVHMAAGHTDGELFNWVSNGVPGTAMPAYADKLTPEERWHAINFIRTFVPVQTRALSTAGQASQ